MLPETMTKVDNIAMSAIGGGGITIWATFNQWASQYSPLITFIFGFVAMVTGIGTLLYKIWDTRVKRNQAIRDRALRHKEMEHEKEMAKRETDDLK